MCAKQKGILPLTGTIDRISFYRHRSAGFIARKCKPHSRETIMESPAFERSRWHITEFGGASKAGKLIGSALAPLRSISWDPDWRNRLTSLLCKIIETDEVNPKGQRTITEGNTALLQGLELGVASLAGSVFKVHWRTRCDRSSGTAAVDLPYFFPNRALQKTKFATHFRLYSAVAELNFETEFSLVDIKESGLLPISKGMVEPLSLETRFTPNSTNVLLQLLGVALFQFVNGKYYSLNERSQNAMSIVAAEMATETPKRPLRQVAGADPALPLPVPDSLTLAAPDPALQLEPLMPIAWEDAAAVNKANRQVHYDIY